MQSAKPSVRSAFIFPESIELDRERAYPTDFVNARTSAGFLAALIPEDYGGSGLAMTAAAGHFDHLPVIRLAASPARLAGEGRT